MTLYLEGSSKEIAAFVLALQGQQDRDLDLAEKVMNRIQKISDQRESVYQP